MCSQTYDSVKRIFKHEFATWSQSGKDSPWSDSPVKKKFQEQWSVMKAIPRVFGDWKGPSQPLRENSPYLLNDYSMCVCVYIYIYLPTPPLGQDMTQGQFLSGV